MGIGKDTLDAARLAVSRLHGDRNALDALIECKHLGLSWTTRRDLTHVKSTVSDPTQMQALAASGALDGLIAKAQESVDEDERAIGVALGIIEGCRVAWSDEVADTIEAYYIDGPEIERMTGERMTWEAVAERLGISPRTAFRRRDMIIDWIDDVGVDGAIAGRFV